MHKKKIRANTEEDIIKELIKKEFPELKTITLQIERVHQVTSKRMKKISMYRFIFVKVNNIKFKDGVKLF